jgi:predicted Zn-dependent protease
MLALTELREKNPAMARDELAQLANEFPDNPLFARELVKATALATRTSSPGD